MNMLQTILKQLWNEKRHAVWLLLELVVVFLFLLLEVDFSWIKLKNYREPRGFDVENTYRLELKSLTPGAIGYLHAEGLEQTEAEMLDRLVGQLELHPDVEAVGYSRMASPTARGGWWTMLFRRDSLGEVNLQGRTVDEGYLKVFRLHRVDGGALDVKAADRKQLLVSGLACEKMNYASLADVPGDTLYMDTGEDRREAFLVTAVYEELKSQPFRPYSPSFFEVPTRQQWNEVLQRDQAQRTELWLRVREGRDAHFREHFKQEMGERLWAGQIYVSSVVSVADEMRKMIDTEVRQEVAPMMYVLLFVLLTAFLGVFGTFWLRTRQRCSEVGIRMAMGASRQTVWRLFMLEGVCLAAVAVLPALLIYVNLLYAEVLNVYDLPFTAGRVLLVLAVSLLVLLAMILAGIWFPARQASRMNPVDALRDE